MASCSRRRLPGVLAAALCALPGCISGHLLNASRVNESVVEYTAAYSDGTELWLAYEVELAGAGLRAGSEPRAAVVALRDLRAQPEIPVDTFPLRRLARPDAIGKGLERVPIRSEPAGGGAARAEAADAAAPLAVVVRVRDGAAEGFELRSAAAGTDGEPPPGRFHSEALGRTRNAWWVYPALPFGVAVDLVLAPIHAVVMSLFVLFGV